MWTCTEDFLIDDRGIDAQTTKETQTKASIEAMRVLRYWDDGITVIFHRITHAKNAKLHSDSNLKTLFLSFFQYKWKYVSITFSKDFYLSDQPDVNTHTHTHH